MTSSHRTFDDLAAASNADDDDDAMPDADDDVYPIFLGKKEKKTQTHYENIYI